MKTARFHAEIQLVGNHVWAWSITRGGTVIASGQALGYGPLSDQVAAAIKTAIELDAVCIEDAAALPKPEAIS